MKLAPHSKIVFIGDSITDCERTRPIGEGLFDGIGKSYVSLVEGFLTAIHPADAIRLVNMGTSGDTVLDLKKRWKTDALDLKPDWLSIMIGVNDVWRQFDLPRQKEIHVSPKVYEKTLLELTSTTRPKLKGLIIMAPFYLEPNREDPMRKRMDQYGAICKKVARKSDAIFIDTQAVFDDLLTHMHANAIAWDRVHPNTIGHSVIARAFLNAIDVPM